MTTAMRPPAWYGDPSARHRLRYWDGQRWTDQVSDGGPPSIDVLPALPPTAPYTPPAPFAPPAPYAPPVPPTFQAPPPSIPPAVRGGGWVPPGMPGRRRPWYARPWPYLLAAAVLAIAIIVPAVNRGGGTTAAAPTYPGRLLGVSGSDPSTVRQLTSASTDTVDVTTIGLVDSLLVASPDGAHLAGLDGTVATVATGAVDQLPELGGERVASLAFAPDGTRLAYTTATGGKVVVYDLATKTGSVILQTPCDRYTAGLYSSMTVCGSADSVSWIDTGTLLTFTFNGAMPASVSCSGPTYGIPTSCTEPEANIYTVVSATGQQGATAPGARVVGSHQLASLHGPTVLLGDGTWFDVNQVNTGAVTPTALPTGALTNSVSPDGTKVLVPGQPAKLVDIRTGAEQVLGTDLDVDTEANVAWSPDAQFVAVQDVTGRRALGSVFVVPISTTAGGDAGDLQGTLVAWLR